MRPANPFSIALVMLATAASPGVAGVWGATDQVPAASLIVPFFEVGIDSAANPHDTLTVVYNRGVGDSTIHYEVWSLDGEATIGAFGNVTIPSAGSWSGSLRTIIGGATASDRTLLTDGDFYRGFVTIDAVTEDTADDPFEVDYPFAPTNALIGYTYYVRLAEGSANGLAMIPLEHTAAEGVPARLEGFYSSADDREEIDVNARRCAAMLSQGDPAVVDDYLAGCNSDDDDTVSIRTRIFQSAPLSGNSRVIVFTWDTSRPDEGGPTAICDAHPGLGCPTSYSYARVLQNGTSVEAGFLALDHVVNIIEPTGATGPGEFLIFDVQDPDSSLQLFAFSFNSASPAGNPNVNWDAIFEGSIEP